MVYTLFLYLETDIPRGASTYTVLRLARVAALLSPNDSLPLLLVLSADSAALARGALCGGN